MTVKARVAWMTNSIWPNDEKTVTLLDAARQGDSDAVNRLLQRHRAAVRRLVQVRLDHKVRRRVDISDVVQEVMVEASGRLEGYLADPTIAFHLWLRQITWDRIIDTYRRHRGSAKRSVDREQPMAPASPDQSSVDLAAQLHDPSMTPAAAATQREIAGQVEQAIEKMNDQDREILIMRHYEHLSNLEVSQALNLSAPATSMRYLRAIRRLRQALQQDGGPDFDDSEMPM